MVSKVAASIDRSDAGMTSRRRRRRLTQSLRERGITDERVLTQLEEVQRHRFIDEALHHHAYEDTALAIGYQQTISQPYIVAKMTELARASQPDVKRVLDIGTGCGYQAAILSQLVDWVYTIERIPELQQQANSLLEDIGYKNISYRCGDGYHGWQNRAPFDAIVVAAAAGDVPSALVQQLGINARMVIPVGDGDVQELLVVERTGSAYRQWTEEMVRFVPLVTDETER